MPKFVRPPSLRFPQIYGAFKSKDKDSDDIVDYVIQDLPEEYFDEALDLLINDHLPDETLHLCRGVADIEEAISEAREDWRKKLNFRLSIACFRSDGEDDELVGVNVLAVASKDDEIDENPQDPAYADIIQAYNHIAVQHNVFETYNVDKYLTDHGLVINRYYRQRGIAGEFLKARLVVLRVLKLKVTSATFTAIGSQKAAEKAGFKEVFSISFDELGEIFPSFDFSKATAECAKIMDYKI